VPETRVDENGDLSRGKGDVDLVPPVVSAESHPCSPDCGADSDFQTCVCSADVRHDFAPFGAAKYVGDARQAPSTHGAN